MYVVMTRPTTQRDKDKKRVDKLRWNIKFNISNIFTKGEKRNTKQRGKKQNNGRLKHQLINNYIKYKWSKHTK